jgi:hypothetical protein
MVNWIAVRITTAGKPNRWMVRAISRGKARMMLIRAVALASWSV